MDSQCRLNLHFPDSFYISSPVTKQNLWSIILLQCIFLRQGVMVCDSIPSAQDAEAAGPQQVQSQPGLHRKIVCQKQRQIKKIPLFHINLTKSVNNFSLCSAGILMFKSSNYIQGSYLIIKFFIEKYVKFGAEILLSIFLIIFLFLYNFYWHLMHWKIKAMTTFQKFFKCILHKEILKIRNNCSSL